MAHADAHATPEEELDLIRLDASQREWERNDRVRRVLLVAVDQQIERGQKLKAVYLGSTEMVVLVAMLEGIAEVLRGQWLKSPQDMAAARAAGDTR